MMERGVSALAVPPTCGNEGAPVTLGRMSGDLDAMRERGVEALAPTGRRSRVFGRDASGRLSASHPDVDAAICFDDLVALGLPSGFLRLGRRVGAEVRVMGFHGVEDCALAVPPLSSARCGIAAFGRRTAATMLDRLEGGQRPVPRTRAPVSLVGRASGLGE